MLTFLFMFFLPNNNQIKDTNYLYSTIIFYVVTNIHFEGGNYPFTMFPPLKCGGDTKK